MTDILIARPGVTSVRVLALASSDSTITMRPPVPLLLPLLATVSVTRAASDYARTGLFVEAASVQEVSVNIYLNVALKY